MRDVFKEELKTEVEKFKTFVLLLIASVTGFVSMLLNDTFYTDIRIQVLFVCGIIASGLFLFLAFNSYFRVDYILEKLKETEHENS